MTRPATTNRDLIVIGASAGGIDALKKLVRPLPLNLQAAILIVLHVWPEGPSILPEILNRAGAIPARHPQDKEPLDYGRIYIAPPDFHLTVEGGVVRVIRGPRENRHRPAVDPLFRSAALAYGSRVVACVLSGALDDGTAGAITVKRCGGVVIVQEPDEALHPGMPKSVLENIEVDAVLPVEEISAKLMQLARANPVVKKAVRPFEIENSPSDDPARAEIKLAELNMSEIEDVNTRGKPSVFACPECHGTLWEVEDGKLLRFRCRVGHAYTASNLSAEQSERAEQALWVAFRALEEASQLHRRMAERARSRGHARSVLQFEEAARQQEDSARVLRELILKSSKVETPHSEYGES